jgi:membrane-bound inhibitor of C-type lysozyme
MKKNLVPILVILVMLVVAGIGIWYASKISNINSAPSLITKATYNCDGNKTITAAFYEGKTVAVQPGQPPIPTGSVKLVLSDGRNMDLSQTISADGARYANSDESFVFWSKGDGALFLENNAEKNYTNCVVTGTNTEVSSIKVISPNGGEVWLKGQNVQITWSASKDIKTVNIRLAILGNPDAQNFNAAIASGVANTGTYNWTVQELFAEVLGIKELPASDKYQITVEDAVHNNVWDASDATFTIKIECKSNNDCQNGASCMTEGPLVAGQPVRKVCVPQGQAVPL